MTRCPPAPSRPTFRWPPSTRLALWNRTDAPLAPRSRLEQWVAAQCDRTPAAVAVTSGSTSLTYRELESRANRFAQVLRARGAVPARWSGSAWAARSTWSPRCSAC